MPPRRPRRRHVGAADRRGRPPGGRPARGRAAATVLTAEAEDTGHVSTRVRLLADIRAPFTTLGDPGAATTAELLAALNDDPEGPWQGFAPAGMAGKRLGDCCGTGQTIRTGREQRKRVWDGWDGYPRYPPHRRCRVTTVATRKALWKIPGAMEQPQHQPDRHLRADPRRPPPHREAGPHAARAGQRHRRVRRPARTGGRLMTTRRGRGGGDLFWTRSGNASSPRSPSATASRKAREAEGGAARPRGRIGDRAAERDGRRRGE